MITKGFTIIQHMLTSKQKILVIGLWLTIIVAFWWYARASDQSLTTLANNYLNFLAKHPLSPIVMFLIFMVRPLLLLPTTILIVAMGFLYGVFWGSVYGQIAISASSSLGYIIGRYFSKGINEDKYSQFLKNVRKNSFESILLSRLIFLPGDLVNYGAGFLKINYLSFLLGTLIGGAPGMLIAIFAGASIEGEFAVGEIIIRKDYLLISTAILLLNLILFWWLRVSRQTKL